MTHALIAVSRILALPAIVYAALFAPDPMMVVWVWEAAELQARATRKRISNWYRSLWA